MDLKVVCLFVCLYLFLYRTGGKFRGVQIFVDFVGCLLFTKMKHHNIAVQV